MQLKVRKISSDKKTLRGTGLEGPPNSYGMQKTGKGCLRTDTKVRERTDNQAHFPNIKKCRQQYRVHWTHLQR